MIRISGFFKPIVCGQVYIFEISPPLIPKYFDYLIVSYFGREHNITTLFNKFTLINYLFGNSGITKSPTLSFKLCTLS